MWLMPGDVVVDLAGGIPRSAASSLVVCWTEWHRPTVRIGLASATAQHSIAIGLT
jgi:hypothetical protein